MNVVILWHMHQPYYVNPLTKKAMMPWVRLHAAKGYLDMIDLVTANPDVRVTFNFTPVLVRQIHELVSGEVEELKTNFISMMSHDLKTPIARIQGMTEIISSTTTAHRIS